MTPSATPASHSANGHTLLTFVRNEEQSFSKKTETHIEGEAATKDKDT